MLKPPLFYPVCLFVCLFVCLWKCLFFNTQSVVVTLFRSLYKTGCNITHCILSTYCVCGIGIILTMERNYFPRQHETMRFCDRRLFLWYSNKMFKYCLYIFWVLLYENIFGPIKICEALSASLYVQFSCLQYVI
jgi:hypothetical protein